VDETLVTERFIQNLCNCKIAVWFLLHSGVLLHPNSTGNPGVFRPSPKAARFKAALRSLS